MKQPRILFYVQYLLGIGHVRRSSLIVQALCQQGAQVDVIFGGLPVPSMSFGPATIHQLTAVKSKDAEFSGLVKADGSNLTEHDKQQRTADLIAICEKVNPDLIVTETYPFGRRQMRFELKPLLAWAKSQTTPPILVSSVRDILQRRKADREQESIDLINAYYDHALVHGDARFYPLERSFPPAVNISDKVSYSGYVCPELPASAQTETNAKIVISIGGGSVGKYILDAALALYDSGFEADKTWLFITGPNMTSVDKNYFQSKQSDNLLVTDLADDFLRELNHAHVSVSMAGYNTVMDLLLTQVPAVVIPFEGEGETEQLARSRVLAEENVLTLVEEQQLNADTLKTAIISAVSQAKGAVKIDNQGAHNSASLLIQWARGNDHE